MAKDVVDLWRPDDGRWQRVPLRGEAVFVPKNFEQLQMLRDGLADLGHPPAVINGITGWLIAKALHEPDTTSSATRAKYRRILREVDPEAFDGAYPVLSAAA